MTTATARKTPGGGASTRGASKPGPAQDAAPDNSEQLLGADLVVRALEAQGVTTVFGYPGGAIMPIYDALTRSSLVHILARHEQGAVFAAEGYARASGQIGVCMATSGPGATNLITGLANAFLDSVPLVAVTGQVPQAMMGTDAFQEVDVFGLTMPVVKHSFIIRDIAEIPSVFARAFAIAREGRPGPVLIDIPKDVTQASTPTLALDGPTSLTPRAAASDHLSEAEALLRASKKPLLYVGGGVRIAGAVRALRTFAGRCGIPSVTTLNGIGAIPTDDPLHLGMLGMHGLKAANLAVQSCDLLICAGARFDDRATGKLAEFAPHARVIHLDIDNAEISKLRRADVGLTGGLLANLYALEPGPLEFKEWLADIAALKAEHAWRYDRSEERRVGKECRSRWSPYH